MPVDAGRPLKVLHIAHGAPGGIGRVEMLLAAVWARDPRLQVKTLYKISPPPFTGEPRAGAHAPRGGLQWAVSILRACVRTRADVVLLNHLNFTPFAAVVRLFHPTSRVVVWAYGVEAWKRPKPWHRLGLRFVDQVWSISQHTAREFSAVALFPPERIVVVPLALTAEQAERLMRQPQPKAGRGQRVEVLTVSRLWRNEAKGIDHLIESLAANPTVRLTVVGDGEDRPRLEALAEGAGVAARVTFTGHVTDATVIELYRRCALFALPSFQEGFGLAFLEAMTAGKPVIAAGAGAVPELVLDGETGLLVPFGDRGALAGAIAALIADPERASTLGARGRERALNEFGFRRFADQISDLLVGSGNGDSTPAGLAR